MNEHPSRILIIDDEESICWGLAKLCKRMQIDCDAVSSAEAGVELAETQSYQTIIMDVRLPGLDGISAIETLHQVCGPIPIITITAFGDLQTAIAAIQAGAFEYIVKPFDLQKVEQTIRHAIALSQIKNSQSEFEIDPVDTVQERPTGLVGSSPVMQELFRQIALTTTNNSPVLITGESGTGKELTARAIHKFSRRSAGPFVAVNIAALNPSLVESELFGHMKGAFTGAESDRTGLLNQANGGTLFLDEVAEIPMEIQVKLLRVLDQNELLPVGSNVPIPTDFRLLTASHQDLHSLVNHREFRHDLLYRLRTFEIQLPPLREHRDDIPDLVNHFLHEQPLDEKPRVTTDFLDSLKSRPWKGNVRELRNVVERAAILARGGLLTPAHIQEVDISISNRPANDLEGQLQALTIQWAAQHAEDESDQIYEKFLEVIEPPLLCTTFENSGRQYSAAARKLGLHRTTLKKKLDEFGNGEN